MELGDSEIQLNYELEKQKYNISFVYDDKKGYIKGEKVITGDKGAKLSYTFTPVPNKDCEIKEVTINGEKATAQKDGTYTCLLYTSCFFGDCCLFAQEHFGVDAVKAVSYTHLFLKN